MAIGFYFSGRGRTIQLPVNPAELVVQYSGNNQRTEIVKLGEINILRDRKLASISLEFLLPADDYYPFIVGNWRSPQEVVQFFRKAQEKKFPLRLVVTELGINLQVSVEDVSEKRVAGDHESILCAVSLLEYRSYGVQELQMQPSKQTIHKTAPKRESDRPQSKTHTVKSGESFWAIAQRELGDGSRYNEIAKLNGMTASSLIHPGDVLKLPER